MGRRILRASALIAVASVLPMLVAVGCGGDTGQGAGAASASYRASQLILATTTSVKDSGLLDEAILPAFAKAHPDMTVKTIAVGSGEALAMGERGEADVLLVHSPKDEAAFMAAGYGTLRLPVAYNYFVIVGPAADPAGVAAAATAADAFRVIAASGATFVSRGDESGTQKKELEIWEAAGVRPDASHYVSTGQGMGETLQIASEKRAYTLTDLATYLSMEKTLDLRVLTRQSPDLKNSYSVIIVSQLEHASVNAAGAELFAALLVSPEGQRLIAAFGRAKYGRPLFYPDAEALGTGG